MTMDRYLIIRLKIFSWAEKTPHTPLNSFTFCPPFQIMDSPLIYRYHEALKRVLEKKPDIYKVGISYVPLFDHNIYPHLTRVVQS